MTRDRVTLVEGLCWFTAGLLVMGAIAKLAFEYR